MAAEENQVLKRVMPHSDEAEQSVIGAMLMDSDAIEVASEILTENDFYNSRYKILFKTITDLYQNGITPDPVTVSENVKKLNAYDEVASVAFIGQILTSVVTSANVKHHANIVAEKSFRRNIIKTSEEFINQAYSDSTNINDLSDSMESDVFKLVNLRKTNDDYVPISTIALDTLANIESAAKTAGSITGISTGFKDLDYRTAGLQPSDLILIAARPSMGKTAFALNIAENIAMINHTTTAIFSLEMSKIQLAKRLISMNSKVDSQHIRTGNLEDNEWIQITESAITLGESALIIDDTPGISINELRSKCRKFKAENNLGVVLIDYLQLMSASEGRKNESRQQEISTISRSLKALAREIDCPVIALSQLSREVEKREDKRPMLSDLRESGAIEQDADVVMFLYREEYYKKDAAENKGITEVIIGKQRNGPTCTVKLKWLAEYTKFANLEFVK